MTAVLFLPPHHRRKAAAGASASKQAFERFRRSRLDA
jgi:hypothetical protein